MPMSCRDILNSEHPFPEYVFNIQYAEKAFVQLFINLIKKFFCSTSELKIIVQQLQNKGEQ